MKAFLKAVGMFSSGLAAFVPLAKWESIKKCGALDAV